MSPALKHHSPWKEYIFFIWNMICLRSVILYLILVNRITGEPSFYQNPSAHRPLGPLQYQKMLCSASISEVLIEIHPFDFGVSRKATFLDVFFQNAMGFLLSKSGQPHAKISSANEALRRVSCLALDA